PVLGGGASGAPRAAGTPTAASTANAPARATARARMGENFYFVVVVSCPGGSTQTVTVAPGSTVAAATGACFHTRPARPAAPAPGGSAWVTAWTSNPALLRVCAASTAVRPRTLGTRA